VTPLYRHGWSATDPDVLSRREVPRRLGDERMRSAAGGDPRSPAPVVLVGGVERPDLLDIHLQNLASRVVVAGDRNEGPDQS